MCQQIYLLSLFDGPGIRILFYTIPKLIRLSIEIVLVMDNIVSSLFARGDRVNCGDLPDGFNSIYKCGDDQPVSPKESQ